jgi:hypothetical protein
MRAHAFVLIALLAIPFASAHANPMQDYLQVTEAATACVPSACVPGFFADAISDVPKGTTILNGVSPEAFFSDSSGRDYYAAGSAAALASFGDISGVVTAATQLSGPVAPCLPYPACTYSPGTHASASLNVGEGDTLTVGSRLLPDGELVLPKGTPVVLKVTDVIGSFALTCGEALLNAGSASFTLTLYAGSQSVQFGDACGESESLPSKYVFDVITTVGSTVPISGLLQESTNVSFGAPNLVIPYGVDPSIDTYVTPITVGATYTSASGTVYSPPVTGVPEPSPMWLMLFGLGGVVGLRRAAVAKSYRQL